jgi:cyanophycin synthetase
MKVLEVRVMEGPNYWSVRKHQLVVMLLDLEELEEQPTNLIPGFYSRLTKLMPSLEEHACSEGTKGGFFKRVKEGTWMGHVIEHIAIEIQTLAGMPTSFGRTRGAGKKGLYHVVFAYEDQEAGKYAAYAAVRIAEALIKGISYNLEHTIEALRSIANSNRLGPSTHTIIQEARKRNIPVLRLNNDSQFQLGYGSAQQRIEATIAGTTSSMAVELAANKNATKQLLQLNYIPVPEGTTLIQEEELPHIINQLGFPLVIKPLDSNQGKGATTNIKTYEEAVRALALAKEFSQEVICEKYIPGSDFRILVIGYRFVAAALRTPACVTGDGIHTIRQLVDITNEDPQRGSDHENVLTRIKIDDVTLATLAKQGYTVNDIPLPCQQVLLKPTANLSTGGTACDVTDDVHPANKALFERIARLVGLNICGIDVMAPCLCEPITQNGGSVLEVNAAPGFRMHVAPSKGQPRNVGKAVIDMLFPPGKNPRIPIMAITGTNGKTTTTRLLAHITKYAGYHVGYTTTDGIYINDQLILKGDCTGPVSAQTILKDPGVDMAVLECARGGLLRAGLGFDQCDVAIVTNVSEDHLGLDGIQSLEQLARVKSVLAETVHAQGYAILNADDDHVYNMKNNVSCKVAYFSMNPESKRIKYHMAQGDLVAVYENGYITLVHGKMVCSLGKAEDMPITFSGAADFNIANILPAALAAYTQKIHPDHISNALKSFVPSVETTPGRMNAFDFNTFTVIVDYAHNPAGLKAIGPFIQSIPASVKTGVITGVGDRRDEDIIALGEQAALIFDEIIIRHDDDMRGRSEEDVDRLLCQGIQKTAPSKKIIIADNELESVDMLLQCAVPNALIVFFADNIKAVTDRLQQAMPNNKTVTQRRAVA